MSRSKYAGVRLMEDIVDILTKQSTFLSQLSSHVVVDPNTMTAKVDNLDLSSELDVLRSDYDEFKRGISED